MLLEAKQQKSYMPKHTINQSKYMKNKRAAGISTKRSLSQSKNVKGADYNSDSSCMENDTDGVNAIMT